MDKLANILVIGDGERGPKSLATGLEAQGYQVGTSENSGEAMKQLVADVDGSSRDIVICNLKPGDSSGLEILSCLKQVNPDAALILIGDDSTVESTIESANNGALAYHVNSTGIDAVKSTVRIALKHQRLLRENRNLLVSLRQADQKLMVSNKELQSLVKGLHQSESKYQTVIGQSTDGIFILDPIKGHLIDANPEMEVLTGYRREELLGMELPVLCSSSERERVEDLLDRTLEQRRAAVDYLQLQRITGEQISVGLECNLFEGEIGKTILGTIRHAQENMAEEGHLQETARLVSIGELAAGVAHEINNPLTIVVGFCELLLARQLPQPVEKHLQKIYSEAQRAAKIVHNLVSFARRREPEKQYMDVMSIVEQALELKSHDFKINNIQVTTNESPDLPSTMVDQHQLMQVILNILTNAEQAMTQARGGGELLISTKTLGDNVRISITDDGPGIPPEYLGKIFDPFFTTKEIGKGTGLGLSICYGIVRRHGGDISVQSAPRRGTTFYISLPILGPVGEVEYRKPAHEEFAYPVKHILVVDDEPNIRHLLVEALSMEHYTVELARDGQEAWNKLQKKSYDRIIMDLKC